MSQSIFDWDDDDEKQDEPAPGTSFSEPQVDNGPVHTAPEPVEAAPEAAEGPLELGPSPFATLQLEAPAFEQPQEPAEPVSPLYTSDPFDEPVVPRENVTSPSPYEAGPIDVDTPFGGSHEGYPFGYQPGPFPQAPSYEDYQPDTPEETSRRSGLAFSAGIVFFSSVVFMLFLGWIADWLIGSSPWGLVGGIILGSILGLIQFVRISSRIFVKEKPGLAVRPLMPPDDDEQPRF